VADPADVLGWLGSDAHGVPYHLHPLKLHWSEQGADHDLSVFATVAGRPATDPARWAAVLRDSGWRLPLVGCVCLLVRPTPEFAFRFEGGCMVSPQIAVTAGLAYPEAASRFLSAFLGRTAAAEWPRESVAAEAVLARLGRVAEQMPPRSARWAFG